ncbi:MAG: T9SS type A sorting domain-containing protein [Bacteroidota bacterium]
MWIRLLALSILVASGASGQTWTNADVRGYGYVTGLVAQPQTQTVYARTDVGGVYRWEGDVWAPLLDGTFTRTRGWSPSVESFAVDPQVPGRLWAALGESYFAAPLASIIARSDDDGQTWTATDFPTDIAMGGNAYWRRAGERLAVDPSNSDVVYFGSRVDGLWRTDDGGASWARVASFPSTGDDGGPDDGPCTEPALDGCGPGGLPFVLFDGRTTTTRDGQTVSANVYVGALGDGVWRSSDGGATWSLAVPLIGTRDNPVRADLAHGRLHIAVQGDGGFSGDGRVLVYTPEASDGGTVVDKTPPPNECPIYGPYDWNAVVAHPTDPGLVVAITYGINVRKVFFTRDITADVPRWEIQTDEGPYTQCPDQQLDYEVSVPGWADPEDGAYSYGGAALFDPVDPSRFWLTNGWGIYRFDDLVQDGTALRFSEVMGGLEESCVTDVAAPGGAGPAFYSAAFDAFGWPHTSPEAVPSTSFARGVQQNGTDVAVTPADPLVAVTVGARNGGYLPASRITRDGGQTWTDLPGLGDPIDPGDPCVGFLTAGNIAISATDPDRMVWSPQRQIVPACTGYSEAVITPPHVTSDAGQTWRPIQGYDVPSGNWAAGGDFVVSQHLVADRVDGGAFYSYVKKLDDENGTELWRSLDGGETWENACENCLPDFRFPRLQAHPGRAGEVWGVFRKIGGSDAQADLFRSTDYGSSWGQVTTADSVWAFGFGAPLAPEAPHTVYAHAMVDGVEGIYYSTDDAATWQRFGGDERVPIGLFEGMMGDPDVPGVVYAGTTCRGAWVGALTPATASGEGADGGSRLRLEAPRPNPASGVAQMTVTVPEAGVLRVEVLDALGRRVYAAPEASVGAGVHPVAIDAAALGLAPGAYIVRVSVGDASAAQRLTLVR